MITLAQIKAARALLDWTQERLAAVAGLSLPAVNNLERGLTSPRRETLAAIMSALDRAGVEFLDTNGVRLRTPDLAVEIIEGADWLSRYDEDIITRMKTAEDEILQFSCDERNWMIHGSTTNHRYIDHRNKVGFRERILVPDSCTYVSNLREVYRALPAAYFAQGSYQVYADRTALILWESRKIVLIKSVTQAEMMRAQFEAFWQQAHPFSDAAWAGLEKWTYGQGEAKPLKS